MLQMRERNALCAGMTHKRYDAVSRLQHYNSGSKAFGKCCEVRPNVANWEKNNRIQSQRGLLVFSWE